MRIALAQIHATADPARNLLTVERAVARAAEQDADLVVFPEATQCRFGVDLGAVAEPPDGPWADTVRTLAHRYHLTVVAGMFTPRPESRVANTLLVVGPDVDDTYDKIHLYDAFGFRESDTVAAGDRVVTASIAGTTVGFATCYDLRFPELFRALADRGAELAVLPASWGTGAGKLEQWRLLARTRALDATLYLAAVDQADPATLGDAVGTAPRGIGHSMLVDPAGGVLAELGEDAELRVAEIDLSRVTEVRRGLPVLSGRRPDVLATTPR